MIRQEVFAAMKGPSIASSTDMRQASSRSRVISVPWGPDGSLELTLPPDGSFARADIEVVWPDLSSPLSDYPGGA